MCRASLARFTIITDRTRGFKDAAPDIPQKYITPSQTTRLLLLSFEDRNLNLSRRQVLHESRTTESAHVIGSL